MCSHSPGTDPALCTEQDLSSIRSTGNPGKPAEVSVRLCRVDVLFLNPVSVVRCSRREETVLRRNIARFLSLPYGRAEVTRRDCISI